MTGIPDNIMGDVWPQARPGADDANYGYSTFEPQGPFPIRSFQTFTLTYTVGEFGLDDTGAIKIVNRWMNDGGILQFTDPTAPNYVTAIASNGAELSLHTERYPHQRPWYNGLRITLSKGFMNPGDTITVVMGDKSGGSQGLLLQTFYEEHCTYKVLADVCATGVFLPVGTHSFTVTSGQVSKWVVAAPTLRRVGEVFSVGIRGEDEWGNATDQLPSGMQLLADGVVEGLPASLTFFSGKRGHRIEGLRVADPATLRFSLLDASGEVVGMSNPLVVKADGPAGYWADLHGQSGESVGIDPMRSYLEFARDIAFLDVTSHQANDFQVTNVFWLKINDLSSEFNVDGHFTVFPGYEWSGNTPVGGDHNVFFASEGNQIRRSSHALLEDRSDIDTDVNTLPELFDAMKDQDCVIFAHVGGRPADISYAEDAKLRTAVEVHSDWGTFEWIMTDAFDLGYRVGLVCNSDGHKGAPGACYPGASEFGAYSGLTCYLADDLSRASIFDAMRKRRHYGTTGCRMHMEVIADLGPTGGVYSEDPRISDNPARLSTTALMGDIVAVDGNTLNLQVNLETHAPIERVDILNGADTVKTLRPYTNHRTGRLRVLWQGAEYRGRGRTTYWNGQIRFDQARINRIQKINSWNLDRKLEQIDDKTIAVDAVTTGNFGGCDIWLDSNEGQVTTETDLVSGTFDLSQITDEETILDAGGLDRKIRLFRLPETLTASQLSETVPITLVDGRDNPLWIRVTTEDGFVGWSSPIYVTR